MVGLMSNNIPEKIGWRKGPWTPEEDKLLSAHVSLHGEGRWSSVAKCAGLNRSGKSCRLRWVNYLRPGLKRGQITPQEEGIIVELHALWGNKWSTIARYLPGRTDNEIKNFWRTHFKNKDKSYHQKQLMLRKRRSRVLKEKLQNDMLQAHDKNAKTTPQMGEKTEPETKPTSGIDHHHNHHHLQTELGDNMHTLLGNPTSEYGSTSLFPWSDAVADHEYGSWGSLLWNLDDNNNIYNHSGKLNDITPIQHQARAFSSYSGSEYIF